MGHLVGWAVRIGRHKLGGDSGDVLGLVVEAIIAMLLAFAVQFWELR
ncbi:MAG: hypothetical protein H6644_19345 [Caldilineaceae bacterium]|nr:hypothetical protein [Caldilineaceae bacterium]